MEDIRPDDRYRFLTSNAYHIITCPKVTLTRLHKALPLDFAGKIELDRILKKIR